MNARKPNQSGSERLSPGEAAKPVLIRPTKEERSEFERLAKRSGLSLPRWMLEQIRKAVGA